MHERYKQNTLFRKTKEQQNKTTFSRTVFANNLTYTYIKMIKRGLSLIRLHQFPVIYKSVFFRESKYVYERRAIASCMYICRYHSDQHIGSYSSQKGEVNKINSHGE